ncbi:protein O-mannosyl-transferase [Aureococcus anophagefferens]|uniref:Protein O-mannosyl-transferase n=1 Tax=Aureococcus anophagefferens TaxID=44056 RepID=A0ABR1FKN9_AURAN
MAELGDFICQGRVSAKEVSVEMMDYTYVDKCEDLPELRSILKELKTGTYGRYPHLEGHVEKKILNLLPPKERAKYEALTREPTALDARLAREEVESFSKAQMEDDERLRTEVYVSSKPRASRLPPPRNAKPGGRTEPAPRAPQSYLDESEKKDKKDRISGYDFRSWDTFDVDAECSKVDEADKTKEAARKRAAEDRKRAEEAKARRSLADLKGAADALGVDDLAPAERAFLAAREKHKGNEAYKAGESRDAYDAYTRSLAYDGANAVVFANRAMASIRLGLLERAEDDCTCALKIDPDYAKARQRRGMTRHKRGKYAAAIEDLERACAEDPTNEPLRKLLKQSCDKYEDVEGQKAQLKRDAAPAPFVAAAPVKVAIEDDDESEEDVPIKAAPVKVAIEDDDESEEDVPIKAAPVKVAIDDDDDDDEPPALSSTPKVAVDDDDDAQGSSQASPTTSQGSWEDLGKKKEEEKPADADKLKAEGNALMGAGDFAGAVAKYGAALDADAGHYASRANRSLARLKLGDHAGAAADCDACLSHADAADAAKRVKALFRRAEAREGLGLAEAAGSAKRVELLTGAGLDLETVCKLEPKNDVARNRLRTVSAAMADATDAAAAAATRAAELGAFKESDAKKAAGSEKMKAGDLAGAVACYTAALELWDGNVAARNNRALARLKLEDFDGAVADASAVLVKEPANLKALYRRGVARRATGDLAGSLDDLDALLVLAPGDRAAAAEKKATRAKLDAKNNAETVVTLLAAKLDDKDLAKDLAKGYGLGK